MWELRQGTPPNLAGAAAVPQRGLPHAAGLVEAPIPPGGPADYVMSSLDGIRPPPRVQEPSITREWLSRVLPRDELDAPRPRPQYKAPARPAVEPFHAVSIKPGRKCCEAAGQFGQHRFLSAKAPRLPLPGCNAAECTCCYTHFSYCRVGYDRRAGIDATRQLRMGIANRHRSGGLRQSDSPP